MERNVWLENLEVGDSVVNLETADSEIEGLVETRYIEYTVKTITTTGRVRLNNDVLLDKNGINKTKGFNISPITEEISKELSERKAYCGFKYNTLMSMLTFVDEKIDEWKLSGTSAWNLLVDAIKSLEDALDEQ